MVRRFFTYSRKIQTIYWKLAIAAYHMLIINLQNAYSVLSKLIHPDEQQWTKYSQSIIEEYIYLLKSYWYSSKKPVYMDS